MLAKDPYVRGIELDAVLPVADVEEAHRRHESREECGKLVVRIG